KEWLSSIALDQQQAVTEIEAIRELAALYATATPPDRTALGDLGRICSLYSDLSVTREVAERLFAAGAATEGRGVLLLTARDRQVRPGDRVSLLTLLVKLRLDSGDSIDDAAPDFRALMESLFVDSGGLREFLTLIASHAPRENGPATAAWEALLQPHLANPRTRLAADTALWWLRGADPGKYGAAVPLSPKERDLVIEWLPLFGDPGIQVSREWLKQRTEPVVSLCEGDEARQIRLFGALGDRIRAAEVQSRLLREAESDGFQQFAVRRRGSSAFGERWPLPGTFAEAGFPDLADGLFAAYHDTIRRLTWEHNGFLESYARFLIERKDFAHAESILTPAYQKSIGTEPQLLVDLYQAWGRLHELSARSNRLYLTSGLKVRLDELRALAENPPPHP
ncbi:MAG: hypothetical protein KDL87_15075, partial [Verrucomicrobiae bacterium]|nr:hypothetical protein [Verrucomicrobiae bacterium]